MLGNIEPGYFCRRSGGVFGQCAIITRATLGLVLAPERVRRFQLLYPSLSALTADQRRALTEQPFDQLQGAVSSPIPQADGDTSLKAPCFTGPIDPENEALLTGLSDIRNAAVISDLTYRDDALAFAKFENLLRSSGQWSTPKPWLLTFLRGNNAEQTAAEILAGLTNADVGPFGRITYYPMLTNACRTPLLRLPDEEVVFPFNVIRIPTSNDAPAMQGMVDAKPRALPSHPQRRRDPVSGWRVPDVAQRLEGSFRLELDAACRRQTAS